MTASSDNGNAGFSFRLQAGNFSVTQKVEKRVSRRTIFGLPLSMPGVSLPREKDLWECDATAVF